MIIVLKQDAPKEKIHEFCTELEGMGLQINDSKGSDTHILGLIGDTKAIAEKREQQYDLFKRHGTSPLSLSRQGKQKDFRLHWRLAGGA